MPTWTKSVAPEPRISSATDAEASAYSRVFGSRIKPGGSPRSRSTASCEAGFRPVEVPVREPPLHLAQVRVIEGDFGHVRVPLSARLLPGTV